MTPTDKTTRITAAEFVRRQADGSLDEAFTATGPARDANGRLIKAAKPAAKAPDAPPTAPLRPAGSIVPGPDAWEGWESDLVSAITRELNRRGVEVSRVGQRNAKGSGTTEGLADLSARRPSWPRFVSVDIEVKTETGKASAAQSERWLGGWHGFAWSVADAVAIVESIDALFEGREIGTEEKAI